jgi:sodium transport system permease protein
VAPPAEASDTAPLARSVNGLAAPLLIASWSMGGSLGLIAYMTAGEKERGTMESLLVTVASRVGVVMGKMTLAMLVSLITVALWGVYWLGYLLFVTFAASLGIEQTPALGLQAQGFGVAGLWLLALMLPLMTMVNGLVAAACTFARNYREAGLFTGVLQFGLPVVSFAATFIVPATPGAAVYAVPVVGTLVAVRDLFLQGLAPAMLVLTGVTSILYGALAILLASYVFSREWALMRGL